MPPPRKKPVGISSAFWLDLLQQNEIAGLTTEDDVFTTAIDLAKWAARNHRGKPMRTAKDYIDEAKAMMSAAKNNETKG